MKEIKILIFVLFLHLVAARIHKLEIYVSVNSDNMFN